jgi:hypothetical protein
MNVIISFLVCIVAFVVLSLARISAFESIQADCEKLGKFRFNGNIYICQKESK